MKHFTMRELTHSATAQRLGINNEPTDAVKANLTTLVEHILDPLREAWGAPIIVTSGYRSPQLNKAVHGAASSQHMLGQAADIHAMSDNPEENRKLLDLIIKLGLPFDKLINEYPNRKMQPDWIHVSYSPMNRRQKFTCIKGKYIAGLNG
ncbi:D-Ala-D-Ala carboxypeptidase family metallohydrolase [Sodaliphilus pleomorphus]|uniref:DUF882 domain-containing protein n=1 Tax=Sodaliphilus pleomorphus TaxID=2606626 RepID=A0A6L5XH48_9BACT|nr:DUF882 domain-containing protein [Sodaliphilus pleomorphus]